MANYTCNGPRIDDAAVYGDDGHLLDAQRKPCGMDMTDLIEAVLWDGEVHTVECPNCGTETSVRRAAADAATVSTAPEN